MQHTVIEPCKNDPKPLSHRKHVLQCPCSPFSKCNQTEFLNQVHLWYVWLSEFLKYFIFEWFMPNTNHPEDGISAKNENKGNQLNHITEMCIFKYSVSSHLTASMCSLRKTCWQEQSWSRENFQFRQLLTTLNGILRDQNVNIACLFIFRMIEVLMCYQTTVRNRPTQGTATSRHLADMTCIWQK
jgi:hypothetical protein